MGARKATVSRRIRRLQDQAKRVSRRTGAAAVVFPLADHPEGAGVLLEGEQTPEGGVIVDPYAYWSADPTTQRFVIAFIGKQAICCRVEDPGAA
jgi:hypothetical protein